MHVRGNRVTYLAMIFVILVGVSLWKQDLIFAPPSPALAQSDPEQIHQLYLPVMIVRSHVQPSAESSDVTVPDRAEAEQEIASEEQHACPLEINADASSVSQERLEELARQGVIDWSPGGVPLCKGTAIYAVNYGGLLLVKLLQGLDPNQVEVPMYGSLNPRNAIDSILYEVRNLPTCPEELLGSNSINQLQLQSVSVMPFEDVGLLYRTGDMRPICIVTGALSTEFLEAISKPLEPADPASEYQP